MKNRILALLINGLKASEIVGIVGCTPSYISQLANDPEFKEQVEAGKLMAAAERTEEDHIDARYQTLEHKLLTSMEDAMIGAELPAITQALSVLHKRTDMRHTRKNPVAPAAGIHVNIVSLQLPAHAIAQGKAMVTLNTNNEIIAIDNKPLAPMSSTGVKALFVEKMAAKSVQDQLILQEI